MENHMKKLRKDIIGVLAVVASLFAIACYGATPDSLGGSAFPLTMVTVPVVNLSDAFNEMLQIINAQTTGISTTYAGAMAEPSQGADTSGTTFSGTIQQNPLVQDSYQTVLTTSSTNGVNTSGGYTLIASETNRAIHLTGPITLMASGTAATATNEVIICSNGNTLESFPISTLVNNVPVYASGVAGIFLGSSFSGGCPAGNSVLISNAGSAVATMTGTFVNIPYTIQ